MPNKTPSYKDKVMELIDREIIHGVYCNISERGWCDCVKKDVIEIVSKALDGQAELIYREWASHLPEQASKELLKSKGLI